MIIAESYDDALTARLLSTAADRLGMTQDEALIAFGRYWVHYAANGPLGSIMDFTGDDLVGFIGNLDLIHSNVQFVMPAARMPKFALIRNDPGCLVVRYRSGRSGLMPFVTGLFEGLLDRFGLTGEVESLGSADGAFDFRITFQTGTTH